MRKYLNKKYKIIDWICDEYIKCIREDDSDFPDWSYLIVKAFNLNQMKLPELKKFKEELLERYK